MIGNHGVGYDGMGYDGMEPGTEPEVDDALRSGLRACADLVMITPPPIAAVRRRAQRRRKRRSAIQGLSGLAATCAVIAGIVAWSPGPKVGSGRVPSRGTVPVASSQPSNQAARRSSDTALDTLRTTLPSSYLRASDLGLGWKGPLGGPDYRSELSLDSSPCESMGVYQAQAPVTPAVDRHFEQYSSSGVRTNEAWEAVYVFAPGTGSAVMGTVRKALTSGCGSPYLKVLAYPVTLADEAIVFTAGGVSRNLLVRSGDRVASALVSAVPSGADGATSMDELAKQMAARLMEG